MAESLSFGRYQLLERIASGGMGEVWVGLQSGIGRFRRPVAVKLLLPHLTDDERVVNMFLQEARVAAQLTHANVVQVYDVGFEHERYFIVMELVHGVSLARVASGLRSADKTLTADVLAYVGRALCEALHVAHEQKGPAGEPLNFVHRDVTPHNVLVSVDGAVKLTDFGIARVAEGDRLSKPGVVLGKVSYLPPEQLLGKAVDARADLFAAGATLYYLSSLKKPFDSADGPILDANRVHQPLKGLRPDLPAALIEAIERAMHPDLEVRFQSARDFRNALPVSSPEASEVLGALVRTVCSDALLDLDSKSAQASEESSRPLTGSLLSESGGDGQVASAAILRSRMPMLVAVVMGLGLMGAGALAFFTRTAPEALKEERRDLVLPKTELSVVEEVREIDLSGFDAGFHSAAPLPPPMRGPRETLTSTPRIASGRSLVKKPGLMSFDAVPWAKVELDGQAIGDTPIGEVPVTPGKHRIVFRCPDTGKERRREVLVRSGRKLPIKEDLR